MQVAALSCGARLTVGQDEEAGLGQQLVKNVGLVDLAITDVDEGGNVAL
jgi:hypothetical protein